MGELKKKIGILFYSERFDFILGLFTFQYKSERTTRTIVLTLKEDSTASEEFIICSTERLL